MIITPSRTATSQTLVLMMITSSLPATIKLTVKDDNFTYRLLMINSPFHPGSPPKVGGKNNVATNRRNDYTDGNSSIYNDTNYYQKKRGLLVIISSHTIDNDDNFTSYNNYINSTVRTLITMIILLKTA